MFPTVATMLAAFIVRLHAVPVDHAIERRALPVLLIRAANRDMPQDVLDNARAVMRQYGIVDSGDSIALGIGAMTEARWRDFFETMSGFTTTGASILKDIEALPKSLLVWRSLPWVLMVVSILLVVSGLLLGAGVVGG